MATNKSKFDISIKSGADYKITRDKVIIFNVPITGEIVQRYDDGMAYKPLEEIRKILVDNVPITFLHRGSVNEMPTILASDNVHGFLKKPSLDRKTNVHEDKLYADLIVFRSDATKYLEQHLNDKQAIDVSIGFQYHEDKTKGTWLGKAYDYVQRLIKLDHLAILIDDNGLIHPGRAPAPKYGIGADSNSRKMSEENFKSVMDENKTLVSENTSLKVKVDSLEKEAKANDEAFQTLKSEKDSLKKSNDGMSERLKKFDKAEKAAIDSKRKELSEKYPAMAKVFDSADKEAISEAYDEMKRENKKTLDEAGEKKKEVASDMEAMNEQFGVKND